MIRTLICCGVLALFTWHVTPAPAAEAPANPALPVVQITPQQEEDLLKTERQHIADLFHQRKFDELEHLADDYRRTKAEFPWGYRKLRNFYFALTMNALNLSEAGFDDYLAACKAWVEAQPKSVTARLVQAEAYSEYAWQARGHGFAAEVSPQGAKSFEERMQTAAGILAEAEKFPQKDPELYRTYLFVGRGLGYPRKRFDELLQKGLELDPGYDYVFLQMADILLPRWFGEPGDLEKFADEAVHMPAGTERPYLYSNIVWETQLYHGTTVFEDLHFSWEKTKRGLEDDLRRHPGCHILMHQACYLACLAGDREMARGLFERIDAVPGSFDQQIWVAPFTYRCYRCWARADALQGDQRVVCDEHRGHMPSVIYAPDGNLMFTLDNAGRITIRDGKTGQKKVTLPSEDLDCTALTASDELGLLATAVQGWTGENENQIVLWDLHHEARKSLLKSTAHCTDLAFSPSGRWLAATLSSGEVGLWQWKGYDEPAGGLLTDKHNGAAHHVVFSRDSQSFATVGSDGTVKLWDVDKPAPTAQWKAHPKNCLAVAFVWDGRRLATAGNDRKMNLFGLDGKSFQPLDRHADGVHIMAATPDGRRLVVAADGKADQPADMQVYDVSKRQRLKTLSGHKGAIRHIAISPDGHTIASVSNDGTLRLWDMP